eukprot:3981406-Alexandrium_andersonii.AAC.1
MEARRRLRAGPEHVPSGLRAALAADAASFGVPPAETEPERWPYLEASYREELARVRAREAKTRLAGWKDLVRTDAGAFAWIR